MFSYRTDAENIRTFWSTWRGLAGTGVTQDPASGADVRRVW